MMPQHRDTLLSARKAYSQCANKVEQLITNNGLTAIHSSQIIGIGVATEWLRRASEMNNIDYMGNILNKSKTNDLFIELLRFNFSWFALNAIFARQELLDLFGTPSSNSEYSKFNLLYNVDILPNTASRLQKLHQILNTPIITRLPVASNNNPVVNNSVSTLQAICLKYLPTSSQKGITAQAIQTASQAGSANSLDMPTLLYGFRNWSVHGNTLHGCFGSHPRFYEYVCILQETLAEVHYNAAIYINSKL